MEKQFELVTKINALLKEYSYALEKYEATDSNFAIIAYETTENCCNYNIGKDLKV